MANLARPSAPMPPAELDLSGALPDMSDQDFRELRQLVHRVTGIALSESKRVMLASRLATRLRKLSLPDFVAYRAHLATPQGLESERQSLINAVTTNKTGFFREGHQFDYIAQNIVPRAVARSREAGSNELVIWSAACSTGQEPWTIMMVLAETLPSFERWTIRLLATDIDTQVLERASTAVYSGADLDGVSPARLERHFESVKGQPGAYRIKDSLRRGVTFRPLNFIDDRWPIKSRFDFIMCRNASIYFDGPTQSKLFNRLADLLIPSGWLFVGHAEVLHFMGERLTASQGGIYQLRSAGAGGAPRPLPPPVGSAPVMAPVQPLAPAPPPSAIPAFAALPSASAPRPSAPRASAPRASAPRPSAPRASSPRPSSPRASAPAASAGLECVTINVGETHTSAEPIEIKTLLGSCVAACLYDPVARIGGMNHFLLPHTSSTHELDRQRFGVHAMETLINGLMRAGADRRRLQAKIFGGGNVLGSVTRRPTVGEQNAAFAREFLAKEGIELVAESLGGNTGVEVRFHPHTGKVFVRPISRDLIDIAREEADDMPMAQGGDAELFT